MQENSAELAGAVASCSSQEALPSPTRARTRIAARPLRVRELNMKEPPLDGGVNFAGIGVA
jgi:hypothetical protein